VAWLRPKDLRRDPQGQCDRTACPGLTKWLLELRELRRNQPNELLDLLKLLELLELQVFQLLQLLRYGLQQLDNLLQRLRGEGMAEGGRRTEARERLAVQLLQRKRIDAQSLSPERRDTPRARVRRVHEGRIHTERSCHF
jgi:hypothetical protein